MNARDKLSDQIKRGEWDCSESLLDEILDIEKQRDRLAEICGRLLPMLTAEPHGTLSGMASIGKRIEWYEKLRPVREELKQALAAGGSE